MEKEDFRPRYYFITRGDCDEIAKRGRFLRLSLSDIKDFLVNRIGMLVINGDDDDIRIECRSKEEYDSFRQALIDRYHLNPKKNKSGETVDDDPLFSEIMDSRVDMTEESLLESVIFDIDVVESIDERKNEEYDEIFIWLGDHLSKDDMDKIFINEDNTISAIGSIDLSKCGFYRFPPYIKFRNVEGSFIVRDCHLLESTAGFPDVVNSDVDIRGDEMLNTYDWLGDVYGRVLAD